MMGKDIEKVVDVLITLKRRKDGQTYQNLTALCIKTHGWDADMTTATIQAALSSCMVTEKCTLALSIPRRLRTSLSACRKKS